MPGQLAIDFAGAQDIVQALQNNANARRDDVNSLSAKARPEAVWKGQSATAYTDAFERWKSAENQLVQALEDMAAQVRNIVDNFDDIDTRGAAAFPR